MTIFEMANYYYNHKPQLWDANRIGQLVKAGKLSEEESKKLWGRNN